MSYIAVNELKKSKDVWEKLSRERDLIVTRDGKPCALLIDVSPETVEEDLAEVRRALFSAAVSRVRRRARKRPPSAKAIEKTIQESRRSRRIR